MQGKQGKQMKCPTRLPIRSNTTWNSTTGRSMDSRQRTSPPTKKMTRSTVATAHSNTLHITHSNTLHTTLHIMSRCTNGNTAANMRHMCRVTRTIGIFRPYRRMQVAGGDGGLGTGWELRIKTPGPPGVVVGVGEVAAAGEGLGAGEAAWAAAGEMDAMVHGASGLRVLGRGTRCKTLMASSSTISSSTMFKTPSFPRQERLIGTGEATGEATDVMAVE